MRLLLLLFAPLLLLSSCAPSLHAAEPPSPSGPRRVEAEAFPPLGPAARAEAARIAGRLSLEERAAQVLLVGVEGRGEAPAESLRRVEALGPGGILLFGFNVPEAAGELGPALAAYQEAAGRSSAGLPLLVAVDHEGGTVFRFKSGLTRLPAPAELGRAGPDYAALLGRRSGLELRALGINLALAPVVELHGPESRRFLGSRSFGSEPGLVDGVAAAFIRGLQSAGVAATAKHFPGNAGADPHEALPRLAAGREELERDFYPRFSSAIGSGVGAVMLSHLLVPALDPEAPATLSRALVEGELRGRLGYRGLVLTDDLFMKALGAAPERSAVQALLAGADLLMLSAGGAGPRVRDAIVQAVLAGRLPPARLEEAARRVIELKLRFRAEEALDAGKREAALRDFPRLVAESAALIEKYRGGPLRP